ncbi:MAG: hypothetical protein AAGD13_05970 [Pseudomonadota bacterium]
MSEVFLASLLCALLGGADAESARKFDNQGSERGIRVDCETPTHVIEIGMDHSSSSRDSVHQAVFASVLTDKDPMVILIDADGNEGRYEQEMRLVTQRLGIAYHRCRREFLVRWTTTSALRDVEPAQVNDLPQTSFGRTLCDLDFSNTVPKLEASPTQ